MYRAGVNYGNETGKLKYARERMRRMSRVLQYARTELKDPSMKFTNVLKPEHFELICRAAVEMGKLNQDESIPSASKKIKDDIVKSLELKEGLAQVDSEEEKDAQKLRQVK